MDSILLDTPEGVTARLGWDPRITDHDRKRILARQLVAAKLGVEEKAIRVEREAPAQFGFHTQLFATMSGEELPILIKTASFRGATVAAIAEPGSLVGLDIRDSQPDEETLFEMRAHSHLFDESDVPKLIAHWTRVQAVREADGRGARVKPDHVRLDTPLTTGWIPDRKMRFHLHDLSRESWIITLAYHAPVV